MSFYNENGINNYIKSNAVSGFSLYENSRSLLVVYNFIQQRPVLVILDERYENSSLIEKPDKYEKEVTTLALGLANALDTKLLVIKYPDSYKSFDNSSHIWVWTSEKNVELAFSENVYTNENGLYNTIKSLVGENNIRRFNNNKNPAKKENDALSSAFHIWQRKNIEIGSYVDIDLVRFKDTKITELIELKRSNYSLDKWKPFDADKNNFSILHYVAGKMNVPLILVYNRRSDVLDENIDKAFQFKTKKLKTNEDIYDVIDKLKIFRINRDRNGGIVHNHLGECSLTDFISAANTTDLF